MILSHDSGRIIKKTPGRLCTGALLSVGPHGQILGQMFVDLRVQYSGKFPRHGIFTCFEGNMLCSWLINTVLWYATTDVDRSLSNSNVLDPAGGGPTPW
jgi:hypothetical protein